MTEYQNRTRLLIVKEKEYKSSAFIHRNKIFIVFGLILNALLMNSIIFMFYDMTKGLTNYEDNSPGLPLHVDFILVTAALLQTIFAFLIAIKVWRLGSMQVDQ